MPGIAARWAAWQLGLGNAPGPFLPAGEPSPVTFPITRLVSRVQIALGADLSADPQTWQWVDITPYVRQDLGISLTVGRRDEATQVSTGQAVLKLDNRDGRFTRRNPTGPYWRLLSKNTPIWATVDAGSGERTRIEMFVNEWPKTWADKSGTDSTVTVTCAGILRRLQQGSVVKSALRRTITGANATQPFAYWPLEDGTAATQFSPGLLDGSPLQFVNAAHVSPGSVDGAAGSLPFANFTAFDDGSSVKATGRVNDIALSGLGSTRFSVALIFTAALAATPVTSSRRLIEVDVSGGSAAFVYVDIYTATTGGVVNTNFGIDVGIGGSQIVNNFAAAPVPFDGVAHALLVTWRQSGSDVLADAFIDGVAFANNLGGGAGKTLGTPTMLKLNQTTLATFGGSDANNNTGSTVGIGHLAVWGNTAALDPYDAMVGYVGEMAHVRITRLCAEEGVVYESGAATSPTTGAQAAETLLTLLRDAETVGGGVLHEKRWGLAYQSLAERYNQRIGMALDFDQGHIAGIPAPADDDQRTRNKWTVSRPTGSEYTAEQTTGPMGTGTEGPGVYDDSVSVNVETDAQLASQGGWRVHLGTVDEDRWPSLALNFTRAPALIDSWCDLHYGARITVANPVPQMPPGALDLIVEGHSEGWDPRLWMASLNCSQASAYRVNVAGSADGNLGRVDAANSALAADATDVATTITVASPGALWRTGAVTFDIDVGGEQMTVTNITGVVGDTFTRTVANGWGTADVGGAWSGTSGASTRFAVNGTVAQMLHGATDTNLIQVSPPSLSGFDATVRVTTSNTAQYTERAMNLESDDSNKIQMGILGTTAGNFAAGIVCRIGGVQLAATTVDSGIAATTGFVRMRAQISGTAAKVKVWADTGNEPPNWTTTLTCPSVPTGAVFALSSFDASATTTTTFDDLTVVQIANDSFQQSFTVTRSVNGVVKAQPAVVGGFATKVGLWRPGVYGL